MNNFGNTNKETKLAHEQVREMFLQIQGESGAAIKPIGLFNFFYNWLKRYDPSKMIKVKARNIADVYSALQNEFFLTNGCKNPHEWFYMTQSRWDKYGLGKKAISNSVKFLQHNLLLETTLRQHPYKAQNKVRYYKLNLQMLQGIVRYTEDNNPKNWQ